MPSAPDDLLLGMDVAVDGGGRVGPDELVIDELEALRVPLAGFCYRLLGSSADTDDAVQETLIRASFKRGQYDPDRGRLTTWVHAIATNVCLDMLRSARRRALVVDLDQAASHGKDLGAPLPAAAWIDPMPDARLIDATDPGEVVQERESVRLAFVAALQYLPPRQRAVLVLRDVLAFTAQETAEILDATVPSVNSALQRARALLSDRRPDPLALGDPDDAGQRDLLRRYVTAFEAHDVEGLKAVLRADAVASMPPFAWRLDGGELIAQAVGASDFCAGARLIACRMNGGWGFGQYRPGDDDLLRPFALVAAETDGHQIVRIVTFLGSQSRFGEFGLPETVRSRS
jgi:RNA polymerase sigma-70 factor (TIGR02960 family)